MKKPLLIVTLVSVLILSLATTGLVFAQEGVQPGEGKGGVLREYMHAAIAAELGISVDELEASIEAGEKLNDIAEAQGYDQEAFQALMETAHQNALDAALADGAITQEEYDAIQERGLRGPGGRGPGDHGKIAELLGLTQEELKARLDAGETIPEIAEELGVELPERPEGHGPERIAELLGLTQEELQARLDAGETIPEIAEELGVELPERPEGRGIERIAELLGLTQEELQARLDAGETIPEIAAELGVELPERPEGRGPGGPGGERGPNNNNFPGGNGNSQDS